MATLETTDEAPAGLESATPGRSEPTLLLAFADEGRRKGERHRLARDGVVLGRGAMLFVGGGLEDGQLSRRHAEVRRDGERWVLRDLGSRNGTWVNGRRVEGARALAQGDLVRIGSTLVVFASLEERVDPEVAADLVGPSDALGAVRRSVAGLARLGGAVLITGETGTGKELVARALHAASGRPGELVAVNCGGLSEGTLASELFGHVRGAFTGAVSDRPGLFRAAQRGTLFLDEIGDMPRSLQAHLLRALETSEVRPVGSVQAIPVEVAVLSATNRDLAAAVREGQFRADLYARLSQGIIEVPPLRRRREDVPALIDHLLGRIGAAGRPMTVALAEALLLETWPLNVRGLANVLGMAVQAAAGGALDLRPEVARALEAQRIVSTEDLDDEPADEPSREALDEALTRHRGQVAAVARHFGGSRQQVYRWIAKHGLVVERYRQTPG